MNLQPNPQQQPKPQPQTPEHKTNTNNPHLKQCQPYLQILPNNQYIVDKRYSKQISNFIKIDYDKSMLEQLTNCINSYDIVKQHRGIIGIRRILANQQLEDITKAFFYNKLMSKLLWLMSQNEYPQIRLEACWAIANIASLESQYCAKIIEMGCLHILRKLLEDNQDGIIDQALQAIGNLAADCIQHRDMILKNGSLSLMVNIIQKTQNREVMNIGCWAISNLCRGNPGINKKYIKQPFNLFCKIIKNRILKYEENVQLIVDLLWSIQRMLEVDKTKINMIRRYQILGQIFKYAYKQQLSINVASIRIIGNFAQGDQRDVDDLMNNGIFKLALKMLGNPKRIVRKQICWVLSNIAAGSENQVQMFMSQDDLLDEISQHFNTDSIEVKRQICWIYSNLTHLGDKNKIVSILQKRNIMKIYPKLLLQTNDQKALLNLLKALHQILLVGKKQAIDNINILLQHFIEGKGDQILENLQMHPKQRIYQLAIKTLRQFFITQEDPKQI